MGKSYVKIAIFLLVFFCWAQYVRACTTPPVADVSPSTTSVDTGDTINLSGAGSYDPDGTIVSYDWTCLDGTMTTISQNDPNFQCSFDLPGVYTVQLEVTDNDSLTDTDTCTVTVAKVDEDGDGMDDTWEDNNGLNSSTDDALNDLDSDTYNNICEYLHRTDPNDDNDYPQTNITIYVPSDVDSIQLAINGAIDGDIIEVDEGTYYEQINLNGKSLVLQSTDPNDPDVVAGTIIDANDTSMSTGCITFEAGEDANSLLEGFTITGGYYGIKLSRDVSAGTSPAIRKCVIWDNDNYGIYCNGASAIISNCIIWDNGAGGVYVSSYQNTTEQFDLINCTIYGNNGTGYYSGIGGYLDVVRNCIIWNNGNDVYDLECSLSYCCIEDMDEGTDVIHADPLFIDADTGDFHLWYASSCIDAGDPNDSSANEPDPSSDINMGAYGNTSEATTIIDTDSDGVSDDWESANYLDPNDANDATTDLDSDGLRNIDEYYIDWDPNSDDTASIFGLVYNGDLGPGIYFPTISLAISHADSGHALTASEGTYYEQVNFHGKSLVLQSTDPNDPDVVADTIIDANDTSMSTGCITFEAGEDANSLLEGFTITGGYYGIKLSRDVSAGTSPAIRKCVIWDNDNYGIYCNGASAIISNCVIWDNGAGGVYVSSYQNTTEQFELINCTIYGNTSYGIQGYVDVVRNCIIWNNDKDVYLSGDYDLSYCCVEDLEIGTGVIHSEPLFINASNGDFRLWYSSSCIDAGDPNDNSTNEPDPNNPINMGAYGNMAETTSGADDDTDGIVDGWESYYWPGDDPNLHDPNDNPDGDDFTNWTEYLFRYDPTSTTMETMSVLYYSGLPSEIDPTASETTNIAYCLNYDSNDVTISFSDMDSQAVVREINQTADAGVITYVNWDGKDANGVVLSPHCFDTTILAKATSDPNDTDTWTTVGGSLSSAFLSNDKGEVDANDFDPGKNIPAQIDFDLSQWCKMDLAAVCSSAGAVSFFDDKFLCPGHHIYYWYGRDDDGQVLDEQQNFTVYYQLPQGVRNSGVMVYYDPPGLTNLACNQYRIIPAYREVATISYQLTKNAKVTIDIIDPDGNYFRGLLDDASQSAGSNEVVWDGTDDNGDFVSTEGIYDVEITMEDPTYSEVSSQVTGAITVYR